MNSLFDKNVNYWTGRAEGYSEVNQDELNGVQHDNWSGLLDEAILEHFDGRARNAIRVLDVGTGPGFFAIILTKLGYVVTAVDCTDAMLEQARSNAGPLAERIRFRNMNAEALALEDGQFDVVVSRNLTWNLAHPDAAYREWRRVLRDGGLLLNFDANWYNYLYDEEARAAYENDRANVQAQGLDDHYICTDIDAMEEIAREMPLSPVTRPARDRVVLSDLGMKEIEIREDIGKDVWSETERVNYAATPMFMIAAVK